MVRKPVLKHLPRLWPAAAVAVLIAVGCAGEPEPRTVVKDLLASLRQDTTSYDYLSQLLDLGELIQDESIYTYDSSLTIDENGRAFVSMLQKGGELRQNWVTKQIVLGDVAVLNDTATVEVSFIDRTINKQYYNKMGVHLVDGKWKIFAFRLF